MADDRAVATAWSAELARFKCAVGPAVIRREVPRGQTPLSRVAAASGRKWRDLTPDERTYWLDKLDLDTPTYRVEWVATVGVVGADIAPDQWEALDTPAEVHKTRKAAMTAAPEVAERVAAAFDDWHVYDIEDDVARELWFYDAEAGEWKDRPDAPAEAEAIAKVTTILVPKGEGIDPMVEAETFGLSKSEKEALA